MRAILNIILIALDLYKYVIIAAAVMSWLIAFNVVNIRNDVVRSIWNTLVALTEPLLWLDAVFNETDDGLIAKIRSTSSLPRFARLYIWLNWG